MEEKKLKKIFLVCLNGKPAIAFKNYIMAEEHAKQWKDMGAEITPINYQR